MKKTIFIGLSLIMATMCLGCSTRERLGNRDFIVKPSESVEEKSEITSAPILTGKPTEKPNSEEAISEEEQNYQKAILLIGNEKYEEAYAILKSLGTYNGADEKLKNFKLVPLESTYYLGINGCTAIYEYDEDDNLVKRFLSYADGTKKTYEYTYDGNENLIKETTDYGNGKHKSTEYEYDAKGNLVKRDYFSVYGEKEEELYEYDSKGNVIVIDTKSDNSSNYTQNTYDAKGNLIKTEYLYDNYLKSSVEYLYDSDGNMIREVEYDAERAIIENDCEYNEKGLVTKRTLIYYGEKNDEVVYIYDSNDNLIETTSTRYDGYTNTNVYSYDSDGKLIMEDVSGTITEYEYDKLGNIIKIMYDGIVKSEINKYYYIYSENKDCKDITDVAEDAYY